MSHGRMDIYQIIRELLKERCRVNRIIMSLEKTLETGKRSVSNPGRTRLRDVDAPARKDVEKSCR